MARLVGRSRRSSVSWRVLALGVILGLILAYVIAFGTPLAQVIGQL